MGQHHARIYASSPGSILIGVADTNQTRAEEIAGRYNVAAFTNYLDLLDQVEAVSIAAPTTLHHRIGLDCLSQGIHLLMEKPLAASAAEATELAAAAEKSGMVLQVGHVERFNPTFVELANVLADHTILAVEARRLSPFATRAADVSVVYDLMVHDLDLILTLVHEPLAAIQATGSRIRSAQPDHAMALLTFANGQVASVSASKVTQHKVRQMAVTCAEAFVVADFLTRTVMIHRQSAADYFAQHGEVLYRQEGLIEQVYVPQIEPLHAELHHFLACIRDGRPPLVGADDAMRVMAVADAIEVKILNGAGGSGKQ
ncbi:MAG: Gfo/Idh/MocA family oxidoreductase [Caldilineae bacterium]|nr:Gfo/Idh/MocA family oxidoreductase [Anaerolineae bacterium]MCB0198454.1 Gfo/Idh/MocA family oxidoreductase [Anaerolineae bacterium]MCB0254890.1 Gfo/Idh/MocA family oxidoreductase [Anaerolineae bacterium]MCB9154108.1 Gfo/Idh/MocA family oxidoreductase [Caldilineae bacterium]